MLYGNLVFNQLTVELTTASYLGQGAWSSLGGDDIKIRLLAFHFYGLPGVIPAICVFSKYFKAEK